MHACRLLRGRLPELSMLVWPVLLPASPPRSPCGIVRSPPCSPGALVLQQSSSPQCDGLLRSAARDVRRPRFHYLLRLRARRRFPAQSFAASDSKLAGPFHLSSSSEERTPSGAHSQEFA